MGSLIANATEVLLNRLLDQGNPDEGEYRTANDTELNIPGITNVSATCSVGITAIATNISTSLQPIQFTIGKTFENVGITPAIIDPLLSELTSASGTSGPDILSKIGTVQADLQQFKLLSSTGTITAA